MSAMSASSGLMPLSLISEHKAAQGGPPPVQPLSRTPEKHSLVQAPKPTPNGMEPSPPLMPLLAPSQLESQPSLPCGGKSEIVNEDDRTGGSISEIQVPAEEPVPPFVGAIPEESLAAEPFPLPAAPELLTSVNEVPTPPLLSLSAPTLQVPVAAVQQLDSVESEANPVQESLPQPVTAPSPEPAEPPEFNSKPLEESSQEPQEEILAEEPPTSNIHAATTPVPVTAKALVPRQTKRVKQNSSNARSEKKPPSVTEEEEEEEEETSGDDRKSKRKRLPTQPYQCPIPELNLIAKISKIDKTPVSADDKLILFYRNEFLAVRNAEGGFYVCQAMQNVYKTTSRIRIRWLSQVANTDHYSPDFYDNTEFDCILTSLNLERVDKNKFRLPDIESQRTQSILKRAIDVEKGIAPPEETSITEEHPDGLDLSLYRNEDQLKKKKRNSKNKKVKKMKKGNSDSSLTKTRTTSRKVKSDIESKKVTSGATSQQRRLVRSVKVEKPVVQRILAAKKVERRKLAAVASAAVKQAKKETKAPAVKRKSESQPTPVSEKKLKTGASKTRSGAAVGVPSGPHQRASRSSTRTK